MSKIIGRWFWKKTNTAYSEGHAFLIDGYRQRRRRVSYDLNLYYRGRVNFTRKCTYYQYDQYIYCNYGWGGSDNGYYASGVFDTNEGPVLKSGTSGDFQYNQKIIPNVRPK